MPPSTLVLNVAYRQRWSRGHNARGQGQSHKKNSRPRPRLRTALPRTDSLEAKDQGHRRQAFPPKKEKSLQTKFSGDLQKKRSSKMFFRRSTKF